MFVGGIRFHRDRAGSGERYGAHLPAERHQPQWMKWVGDAKSRRAVLVELKVPLDRSTSRPRHRSNVAHATIVVERRAIMRDGSTHGEMRCYIDGQTDPVFDVRSGCHVMVSRQ